MVLLTLPCLFKRAKQHATSKHRPPLEPHVLRRRIWNEKFSSPPNENGGMSQTYAPGSSKNIAPEKRPHQNVFTFLIFTFASPHLATLQKASNEKETPIDFGRTTLPIQPSKILPFQPVPKFLRSPIHKSRWVKPIILSPSEGKNQPKKGHEPAKTRYFLVQFVQEFFTIWWFSNGAFLDNKDLRNPSGLTSGVRMNYQPKQRTFKGNLSNEPRKKPLLLSIILVG